MNHENFQNLVLSVKQMASIMQAESSRTGKPR